MNLPVRILINKLYGNEKYTKIVEWGKLISITGGAQVLIQIISLLCGIIVIRLLPTKEYALYTLANTMLATMTILADSGVTVGIMSEGGKVWEDSKELGIVLATGIELRKKFAVGSLLVAIPILAYLLIHHEASLITTILLILSIIPAFLAALTDSLYEIIPKLHQDIKILQKNQLIVSAGRIILSITSLLIFPYSYIILLANALPRIYGNIKLREIASTRADINNGPSPEIRNRVLKIVKLSIPGLIYYCISGQLNIWLISFFGQIKSIATIGALSRLTMAISLFSATFSTLIIPRFTRLPNERSIILSNFIKIQVLLASICGLTLIIVALTSDKLLWIIGRNYAGLQTELFLTMAGACAVLMVGGTYSLYSTKGWIMHPAQSISISIFSTIIGILLFNVATIRGVLYLNIFVASIEYINHISYSLIKINKLQHLNTSKS